MKRYFTKTGIELTVIQGENKPKAYEPKLKPNEFGSPLDGILSKLGKAFAGPSEVASIKPHSSKRYCLGYDGTTNTYFIDDRVTGLVIADLFSDCMACMNEVDRLNKADETAV